METELAFEISCVFKKLNDGPVTEKKMVSFNFSCAVFCLLDFLTLEHGTDRLFCCCEVSQKSRDLT